jgi:tRNA A-37 threonylcarbamoyl transferase component Bud32
MDTINNPYLNRTAIRDDRDFFGRDRELEVLFSRIDAKTPQSVSIVGDRRIGKSSLLRALHRRRAHYIRRPDEYVFAYLDLQEKLYREPLQFFAGVLEEIAIAQQDFALSAQPASYELVRKIVARLANSNIKMILLLDEFDFITRSRNFNLEFFSFLRSLPNNYPVSFIVTSSHELQELCHSSEVAGSPFFNIFHKLNLGGFTADEASQLVCIPSAAAGRPLAAHAPAILRMAGLIPFFLQMACCSFFEFGVGHSSPGEIEVEAVRQRYFDEAYHHLEYIWEHLSQRERLVCSKICQAEKLSDSEKSVVRSLQRRGYVQGDRDSLQVFSETFERFLEPKMAEAEEGGSGTASRSKQMPEPPVTVRLGKSPPLTPGISSQPIDLSGTRIGRFLVMQRLGRGGMAEVYLAEDTILKRRVALKRILAAYREDPEYRAAFLNEAQRASQLVDHRVARLYDILEHDGEIFLVMEYVEGQSLRNRFTEPLPLEQFFRIAQQCADVLAGAHQRGIIHCDIKPENLMVTPDGGIKILDFGIARGLSQLADSMSTAHAGPTVTNVFYGTPGYTAPETLLENRADGRSDVFSLGVVFYEALTGTHPFRAGTFMRTTDRVLHDDPQPTRSINPGIPQAIDSMIIKCLSKRPDERYQSSAELASEIGELMKLYPSNASLV